MCQNLTLNDQIYWQYFEVMSVGNIDPVRTALQDVVKWAIILFYLWWFTIILQFFLYIFRLSVELISSAFAMRVSWGMVKGNKDIIFFKLMPYLYLGFLKTTISLSDRIWFEFLSSKNIYFIGLSTKVANWGSFKLLSTSRIHKIFIHFLHWISTEPGGI